MGDCNHLDQGGSSPPPISGTVVILQGEASCKNQWHCWERGGSLRQSEVQENSTPRIIVRNSSDLGSKEMEKVNSTASVRLLSGLGQAINID